MGDNEYTVKDAALEMIPIYGTYKSAERFVNNPSGSGAAETGISLVGDIGTLFGVGAAIKGLSFANKARKAYKAANAASKAASIARQKYWDVASTAGKQIQQNKNIINSLSLDDRGLPKKAGQIIRQRIADNKNLENALSTARQVDKNSLDAAKTAYTNASNLSSRARDMVQPSAATILFGVGMQGVEAGVSKHDNGGQIKPNFIKRLEDPNRKSILDWESKPTWKNNYTYDISTHKMGYEYAPDDTGRAIVFPEVQEVNGKLVDFTRPPYNSWAGYDSALDRGDYLMMKNLEEARKGVESYKDRYKNLK